MLSDSRRFDKLAKALPTSPGLAREYIAESMDPVGDEYTLRSFRSAEAVQNILSPHLDAEDLAVSFDHQGSVTNNTHIRVHSDIDLLVVTGAFVSLEAPLTPSSPYAGDPVEDLKRLRRICESALSESLSSAAVDSTGSKSLAIKAAQLDCKVDVVPANWVDTKKYRDTRKKKYRGVHVLDSDQAKRIKNFPFLHNARIDRRDEESGGTLRRLIRLVKSVKYDSDQQPPVSSYDIQGICYHAVEDSDVAGSEDVALAVHFLQYANKLLADERRHDLLVPNDTRTLFGAGGIRESALRLLLSELLGLLQILTKRLT